MTALIDALRPADKTPAGVRRFWNGGYMPDESPETLGNPESVDLLLAFLQDVVLSDETERQRNLDTKAGTLAGFVAVALSLEAGLGAAVLLEKDIACGARSLFIFFFVVAILGLAAAGLFSLLGVLAPKDYEVVHDDQVDQFATEPEMQRPPDQVREMQLATLAKVIKGTRDTDAKKARALKWASVSLSVAVTAIAAQGLSLPFG